MHENPHREFSSAEAYERVQAAIDEIGKLVAISHEGRPNENAYKVGNDNRPRRRRLPYLLMSAAVGMLLSYLVQHMHQDIPIEPVSEQAIISDRPPFEPVSKYNSPSKLSSGNFVKEQQPAPHAAPTEAENLPSASADLQREIANSVVELTPQRVAFLVARAPMAPDADARAAPVAKAVGLRTPEGVSSSQHIAAGSSADASHAKTDGKAATGTRSSQGDISPSKLSSGDFVKEQQPVSSAAPAKAANFPSASADLQREIANSVAELSPQRVASLVVRDSAAPNADIRVAPVVKAASSQAPEVVSSSQHIAAGSSADVSRAVSAAEATTVTPSTSTITSKGPGRSVQNGGAEEIRSKQLEEILLERAEARRKLGDILGTRLFLERAIELGSNEARIRLAQTYDARVLAEWGVRGVRPDFAKANQLQSEASAGPRGPQMRGKRSEAGPR
jgi:hypothetical protein